MPIKINDHLSAICQLQEEGIFTMTEQRATTQRIRPLKVCVLNLMPLKKPTEIQLLRLLGNSPLQIEVDFCRTVSRNSYGLYRKNFRRFFPQQAIKAFNCLDCFTRR